MSGVTVSVTVASKPALSHEPNAWICSQSRPVLCCGLLWTRHGGGGTDLVIDHQREQVVKVHDQLQQPTQKG